MRPVSVTSSTTIEQSIHIGPHVLPSDILVAEGGKDLGPSPHELLAAALGACTAMTLRLYANHKGIQLTQIDVQVDIDESTPKAIFKRAVSIAGTFTPEQKDRLLQVANRCPVHRILSGQIAIETQMQYL